jgi:hypothetical protein
MMANASPAERLHQLTRNAEQVLSHALHAAMRSPPRRRKPNPLDVLSWFEFGDDELLARLSQHPASKGMAMRLVTRDLPKRAFAVFRDVCEPFVMLHDVFDPREWGGPNGPSRLSELETVYYRRTAWRLFDQIVPIDEGEQPRRLAELRQRILREAVTVRPDRDRLAGCGGKPPMRLRRTRQSTTGRRARLGEPVADRRLDYRLDRDRLAGRGGKPPMSAPIARPFHAFRITPANQGPSRAARRARGGSASRPPPRSGDRLAGRRGKPPMPLRH